MPAVSAPFHSRPPSPWDEAVSTVLRPVVVCVPGGSLASRARRDLEWKEFYPSRLALRELSDSMIGGEFEGRDSKVTYALSYQEPQGSSSSDFQSSIAYGIDFEASRVQTENEKIRRLEVGLRSVVLGVSHVRARYRRRTPLDHMDWRWRHCLRVHLAPWKEYRAVDA